jgi:hypothetical protein
VPQYQVGDREGDPDDARALRAWLSDRGGSQDIDVVAQGETPADDPSAAEELVSPWSDAGCTWWLETRWEMPHNSPDRMLEVQRRLAAGPPGRRSGDDDALG